GSRGVDDVSEIVPFAAGRGDELVARNGCGIAIETDHEAAVSANPLDDLRLCHQDRCLRIIQKPLDACQGPIWIERHKGAARPQYSQYRYNLIDGSSETDCDRDLGAD